MAATVTVQGAKQTLSFDHCPQPHPHRRRRFFLHQLCVIDLAPGIIQNDDPVIPALILEPAMPATADVQQQAGQRSPLPPPAMHSASESAIGKTPCTSRWQSLDLP